MNLSKAINVADIKKKIIKNQKKLFLKKLNYENINDIKKYDFVFSNFLGVIHHIPNYKKACKKIYNSLKTNGKFICWVYGYEGNELYIFILTIYVG